MTAKGMLPVRKRFSSMTKEELIRQCRIVSKRFHTTKILLRSAKRQNREQEKAFDAERASVYQDSVRQAQSLVQIQNFVIESQDDLGDMAFTIKHFVDEGLGNPTNDFEFGNKYRRRKEGWHNK